MGFTVRDIGLDDRYSMKPLHRWNQYTYVLPPYMTTRGLMKAYSSPRYAVMRKYVDEQVGHCDDLLLNEVAKAERVKVACCLKRLPGFEFMPSATTWGTLSHRVGVDRTGTRTECAQWLASRFSQRSGNDRFHSPAFATKLVCSSCSSSSAASG